jgi:phenylpropionate dioxygenase-like ring-hydroxylating dioxygenase large terminal subunit
MTDIQQLVKAHYPGNTWQDIARADGDIPDVLKAQSNPEQSTADVSFDRYTSMEFFDLEMEKMWKRVWQYACREENLPEVGDYFVYDLARLSVVIVRTEDGLKGYYNSCLHRGTKLKPSGTSGWSPSITCPYHAWDWNLDGTVKNIPCDWEFPQLDRAKACLPEVRVDSWNGFVFINFAKEGPDLLEYLEVLPEHFRNWDLTGWYAHGHVRKHLSCNWKIVQEAFMEAYHTPVVHPEMTHVVGDHNMQHDIFSDHISRDLCAMAVPSPTSKVTMTQQEMLDSMLVGDAGMVGERTVVPEGKSARWVMAERLREKMKREFGLDYADHSVPEMIDSLKYNVFPNVIFYPAPGLALIQLFRPDGHDQNKAIFDIITLRPKPADGSDFTVAEPIDIVEGEGFASKGGMDAFLGQVLDQDTEIMRWQQEGMYASGKGAETLSIYQESRIRHVHDTLTKYLEGSK